MPGGGDCEGMTGAITSSRGMELPGAAGNCLGDVHGCETCKHWGNGCGGTWGPGSAATCVDPSTGHVIL